MEDVKTDNLQEISEDLQDVAESVAAEHSDIVEWLVGRDDILVIVTDKEEFGDGVFVSQLSKTVSEATDSLMGSSWTTGIEGAGDKKAMVVNENPNSVTETAFLYGAGLFLSSAQIDRSIEEVEESDDLRSYTARVVLHAVKEADLDVTKDDLRELIGE